MTLFREGNDDAFRVIHDRYRPRLFAYTRQMLAGTAQDPEDAVQEIFVRAYYGLRANDRRLALRAWLYRIAHNRCVDDLRRRQPIAVREIDALAPDVQDPVAKVEERDALRRLIADVQRLPDQQRSALLMRELSGMAYTDVSGALGVSVPAVKSLLVRARVSLAQASEARDTACARIREDLIFAHDRGVRTSGLARRHMRDCTECRQFRAEVRGVTRNLGVLAPTLGPLGVIANLLGWGSGAGGSAAASSSAVGGAAGGGAAAAGGAAGTGAAASAGLLAGSASHVVTLIAAAVVTAGGAVELQKSLTAPSHRAHHHAAAIAPATAAAPSSSAGSTSSAPALASRASASTGHAAAAAASPSTAVRSRSSAPAAGGAQAARGVRRPNASSTPGSSSSGRVPISETLDPDNLLYATNSPPFQSGADTQAATGSTAATGATGSSGTAPGATDQSPAASTGATGTGANGTGTATGTGTGPGTTTPTGTGTGTPASTQTGVQPDPSSTTGATGDGTATGSTTVNQSGPASVGASTTNASKGKVVNFISKRHPRHGTVVGGLTSSLG